MVLLDVCVKLLVCGAHGCVYHPGTVWCLQTVPGRAGLLALLWIKADTPGQRNWQLRTQVCLSVSNPQAAEENVYGGCMQ
jgi:hypothetical protein